METYDAIGRQIEIDGYEAQHSSYRHFINQLGIPMKHSLSVHISAGKYKFPATRRLRGKDTLMRPIDFLKLFNYREGFSRIFKSNND